MIGRGARLAQQRVRLPRFPAILVGLLVVVSLTFAEEFIATAKAADDCKFTKGDVAWAEWRDGARRLGARLAYDGRWQEARTMHGQWLAYELESRDAPVAGWLQFGLPLAFQEWTGLDQTAKGHARLAATLEPQLLERVLGVMRGIHHNLGLFAVSEPQPRAIASLDGLDRVFARKTDDRLAYATVIAARDGCLAIYALFIAKDGHALSEQELVRVSSTIRLERYEPVIDVSIDQPVEPVNAPTRRTFEEFRHALGLE